MLGHLSTLGMCFKVEKIQSNGGCVGFDPLSVNCKCIGLLCYYVKLCNDAFNILTCFRCALITKYKFSYTRT